jgi:uncharacterized protein
MIEYVLCSGAVRLIQALLLASPTILVSLFLTGVLRRLFGHEATRRIFGGSGWKSLAQSWALGMLLPGCSLGVIPISRELRRAGLSGGAVLAFALSQPLFDPLSLLYGLTLSKPLIVFMFAGCSLVLVMAVGSVWDWLYPNSTQPEPEPAPVQAGWPRLLSIIITVAREAFSPTLAYIVVGLLGTALLAVILPSGALQRAMNGGNLWAPWTMTWVAIPAYATPTLAMSQLGSMFQHGNSAGAALLLLTLGAGLNLGLLAWVVKTYGFKPSLVWFSLLLVAGLGMAYALDKPLHPRDVDPADHTHAFDIYCSPFHSSETNLTLQAWQRLQDRATVFDVLPAAALGVLVATGVALRLADPTQRIEAWLVSREATQRSSSYDVAIPAPLVGAAVLIGVVALSVVGCYSYYPEQSEVFAEMQIIQAEAIFAARQGDVLLTDNYIGMWDKWSRRLEVGVYLRERRLTRYQQIKGRIFRQKLELLRHEVEDGDKAAASELTRQVLDAYYRLKRAYESNETSNLSANSQSIDRTGSTSQAATGGRG